LINQSISEIYASVVVGVVVFVVVMYEWFYLAEICTLTSAF